MDTTQSAQIPTAMSVSLTETGTTSALPHVEDSREFGRQIGRQIADARQTHGWTQRELGRQVGIGSSLVAKWEQGTRIPPYEWLVELDRVLGTELSLHAGPQRRRRGPRPAVARSTQPGAAHRTAVLVEISDDGVRVFQGEVEVEAVVVDIRDFSSASASDRVRRSSELLLRSLELPRPLAERLIKRIAELP